MSIGSETPAVEFDEYRPDPDDIGTGPDEPVVAFESAGPPSEHEIDGHDDRAEVGTSLVSEETETAEPEALDDSGVHTPVPEFDDEPLVELELVADTDEPLGPAVYGGGIGGTILSILLHMWLAATLAGMTQIDEWRLYEDPIETRFAKTEVVEEIPDEEFEFELIDPNDRDFEVQQVINARSVGRSLSDSPRRESAPQPIVELSTKELREPMYDIPEGMELDDRFVVKGTTGEAIIQIESALDRVTWEIGQNMAERKVLVVWLLDASASLKTQRDLISKRLRRIYGELQAIDNQQAEPRLAKGLLSGVVTYGQDTKFVTQEPTDKFEEVQNAIANVAIDETGVENVFTAVTRVMRVWGKYRTQHGRRILLVVVTDESGDDFGMHETAIAMSRNHGARAYVIGPSAVFGRRKGFVPYVAPENGQTYQLPVDLGPETAMFENVQLPFWFSGPQYEYLSSGFGPYALARLVTETGGVYFTTNMTTMKGLAPLGQFDAQALQPFLPEYNYGTQAAYEKDISRHPLRYAVVAASRLSRKYKPEGTPRMELRVNPRNFKQAASDAQRTVARSQLMVDNILAAFPPGIEKAYDREPSLRWRTAFDLAYGRLLALKVRCMEFNSALAEMKNNLTPDDVSTKSNHWIFRPSDELNYATSYKRQAREATERLSRVVDDAGGTPFAVLAARELRNPLGIRVIQRFIPPPPPPKPNANPSPPRPPRVRLAPDPQRNRPAKPAPKPAPPKLPNL